METVKEFLETVKPEAEVLYLYDMDGMEIDDYNPNYEVICARWLGAGEYEVTIADPKDVHVPKAENRLLRRKKTAKWKKRKNSEANRLIGDCMPKYMTRNAIQYNDCREKKMLKKIANKKVRQIKVRLDTDFEDIDNLLGSGSNYRKVYNVRYRYLKFI